MWWTYWARSGWFCTYTVVVGSVSNTNLKNILVSEGEVVTWDIFERKLPDGGCERDWGARSNVMIEEKKWMQQLEWEQNGRGVGIVLLIDECRPSDRHPMVSSFSSSSRQETSFFHRRNQSYMKLEIWLGTSLICLLLYGEPTFIRVFHIQ